MARIFHAERHRVGAGSVLFAEVGRLTLRLHVEDEVDVVLLVADDVLGAVLGDGGEADLLEVGGELFRLRRGELDELEAVGADGIVEQVGHAGPSSILISPTI
jgi:hypothetical protein